MAHKGEPEIQPCGPREGEAMVSRGQGLVVRMDVQNGRFGYRGRVARWETQWEGTT